MLYRPSPKKLQIQTRVVQVQDLWLKGYQVMEIALELNMSAPLVRADILRIRDELYQSNKASLIEHVEQSVASFRKLLVHLWSEYEIAAQSTRIKLLEQIRKTEESIAKVRGLLTTKIQSDIVHHVKLYDFEDSFPKPIEGQGHIVESKDRQLPTGAVLPIDKPHILSIPNNKYQNEEILDIDAVLDAMGWDTPDA